MEEATADQFTALGVVRDGGRGGGDGAEDGGGKPDAFRILISTILSQRTQDAMTLKATERLFGRFTGPRELAGASEEEVCRLIRGVNFYPAKARRILGVAKIIAERYGGTVPARLEELIELPGVGRKTANCVLVYAFDMDAIPVDTHVHRVSNRLGIVDTRHPEETEEGLKRFFSREDWKRVNEVFVRFGKKICTPRGPRHSACPIQGCCGFFKKHVEKTGAEEMPGSR